ncbi:MAG: hypothetical protein M1113_04760 [Candidatus Thermoplasmatota archaeon]|nr:hypothetical protein [Candidatus Thermoplasmatota archaeon]
MKLKRIQKFKKPYTRFVNAETVQISLLLKFFQAPNSNRLGVLADLYVCSHCGHLILRRGEDNKFFHVIISEDYIGNDPNDNQDHLFYRFELEKQCRTIIDGLEVGDDPFNDTVFSCACDNPEALDEDLVDPIINAFYLLDPTKRKGNVINYDIYGLVRRRPPYGPMEPDRNEENENR